MEKMFNFFSMLVGMCGGVITFVFGGIDGIMKTLLVLIVLDYLTGVLKALYYKKLCSEIGYKGIIKKVIMLIVVATSVAVQGVISPQLPMREIVIMFFIANESLSLLENASSILPVPDSLKNVLLQLKSDTISRTNKDK